MSPLTRWLIIAALLLLVLLAVNAVAYRARFGTLLPRSIGSLGAKRALSKAEVILYFAFVIALLAGFAAPTLAPGSSFATWLAEPYAKVAYSVGECAFCRRQHPNPVLRSLTERPGARRRTRDRQVGADPETIRVDETRL